MENLSSRILMPIIFIMAAAMFLAVIGQVVFRYVLQHPLPWSEELARYLMVWVACLAASEAYRQKSHVGVDFVCELMPKFFQKCFKQLAQLAVLILMSVVVYQGVSLTLMLMDQESPAMGMPMAYAYCSVPFGALLIGLHAIANLIQGFRLPKHR